MNKKEMIYSVTLIIIIYSIYAIFTLNNLDVYNDETAQAFISRLPLNKMLFFDVHPILYPLVLKITPLNLMIMRLLSIVLGAFSIVTVYKISKSLIKDNDFAIYSCFFVIVNPYFIKYCVYAMPYSLAILLSLLSTYFFIELFINHNCKAFEFYSFIIVSILMLFTHHFTIFLLFAQIIYLLYYKIIIKEMIILYGCFFLIFCTNAFKVLLKPSLNHRTLTWLLPFYTIIVLFGSAIIFGIFLFTFIRKRLQTKNMLNEEFILLLYFIVPLIIALIVSFFFSIWSDRYFVFYISYVMIYFMYLVNSLDTIAIEKIAIVTFSLLIMMIVFQSSLTFETPLINAISKIDCSQTYIHKSSFSFLPFEFYHCGNNYLIDNESYYATPITQKDKLIKAIDYQSMHPYNIVEDYKIIPYAGKLVFNESNLMITFIP